MSVLDTVQETLFQQFLAGSDPSRRWVSTEEEAAGKRVEDLPWWKYKRALALWYCEWLDTYYDSGERRFLWRDELTQGFEDANLEEIKDLAQRMRLDLPDHGEEPAPRDASEEPPVDAGEVADEDGNWHVAALANFCDDEDMAAWQDDGQGNFTHWAAEVGRMFLWQEPCKVLYEYVQSGDRSGRWVAKWSPLPLLVLSCGATAPRVVHTEQMLGSEDPGSGAWPGPQETASSTASVRPRHARLWRDEGRWWLEAFDDDVLLNGQRLRPGDAALELPSGSSVICRLGDLEMQVDVPAAGDAGPSTPAAPVNASGATAAPLQRDFVAKEEDVPAPRPATGSACARELNRALRRLVLGGSGFVNAADRRASSERALRYEDRADKRRKLHPVEWPVGCAPAPALEASPSATAISRRFTEKPPS